MWKLQSQHIGRKRGIGGPGHAGQGDAIASEVGMISDGGPGLSTIAPEVEQGVRAAVSYANSYRGGVSGHQINLDICEDDETPYGAQSCANQMVQNHAVVALTPSTGQGAAIVPILAAHKIPYVTLSGASAAELTTTGSFVLTGGYTAIRPYAENTKAHGTTSFAMLVENVPAAIQGAQIFGSLVFKNEGISFKVIPVAPGTADMTPQLQSAVNGGAKAVGITGDVTLCTSFLSGYQSLALTLPKYVLSTCLDKSLIESLGSVLNGSFVASTSQASASDKALYSAVMSKYAPGVSTNPNTSQNQVQGYVEVLAFLNGIQGLSGVVTAQTVESNPVR